LRVDAFVTGSWHGEVVEPGPRGGIVALGRIEKTPVFGAGQTRQQRLDCRSHIADQRKIETCAPAERLWLAVHLYHPSVVSRKFL
jgi:hypothetical protein